MGFMDTLVKLNLIFLQTYITPEAVFLEAIAPRRFSRDKFVPGEGLEDSQRSIKLKERRTNHASLLESGIKLEHMAGS